MENQNFLKIITSLEESFIFWKVYFNYKLSCNNYGISFFLFFLHHFVNHSRFYYLFLSNVFILWNYYLMYFRQRDSISPLSLYLFQTPLPSDPILKVCFFLFSWVHFMFFFSANIGGFVCPDMCLWCFLI